MACLVFAWLLVVVVVLLLAPFRFGINTKSCSRSSACGRRAVVTSVRQVYVLTGTRYMLVCIVPGMRIMI